MALHLVRLAAGAALARAPAPPPVVPIQVDINRAPIPELCALPGIGPRRAAGIVLHRVRHGRFRTVTDLAAVDGIGPGLLASLAPFAVVRDRTR